MFDRFNKIKKWTVSHPKTSITLALVIIFLGYEIFKNYTSTAGQTKYIITQASISSINTTVTGTGQVSATSQLDIQSKVSGSITGVYVKPGQVVKAGTLLAQVDSRDAALSLKSAQIAYDKLVKSAKSQDVKAAQDSVSTAYNDGWNAVSATFVDYPTLITGMDSLFYGTGGYLSNAVSIQRGDVERSYIEKAGVSYDAEKNQYAVVLAEYNSITRSSATTSIDNLISDTGKMVQMMADALKNTQSAVSYVIQIESDTGTTAATTASNVNSWLGTINSHSAAILSAQSSIANSQNTLNNLTQGADPLDIEAQQVSLQRQQLSYQDYFIRAPFDGIIAKVPVNVGDSASGATIATMVTTQKVANISLNEVDVAKIKLGDKVNLTFDAIPALNIAGQVAEIDLVGTVSQGVVNYNIKISFDTQDDRVKSGMSVGASIITQSKQDILVVPSSAVKTQGGISYVDYFDTKYPAAEAGAGIISATAPLSKQVEVGISDDTNTEIVSGLNDGDQIVARTVNQTAAASTAPSIFGAATGGRTGGGAGNAIRRIGG